MSRLAPGRFNDMQMLMTRREQVEKYTPTWNKIQLKIDDLIEEGKCNVMHSLRWRLVGAARASDDGEIIKISHQIEEHNKTHHRLRFTRSWLKKG